MELKSNKYYDTICVEQISGFIHGLDDLYNEIISKYPQENYEFLKYLNELSVSYVNTSNSSLDLKSSLQNIYDIINTIETVGESDFSNTLENELKLYYIRLKSFFDTLLISIAFFFNIELPPRGNKLSFLLKHHVIISTDIPTQLNTINKVIHNFDGGMRNKIIHEGSYQDEMIDDMRSRLIISKSMFLSEHEYKLSLIEKKQGLIIKKTELIDELNLILFNKLSEIHDSLTKVYYDKQKELSHYFN